MAKVQFNCRLTESTVEKIKTLSDKRGISQADVIENWALTLDVLRKPKMSKKAAQVQKLRASDPLGADRPEIEYGSDELPSAGSVVTLDAVGVPANASQGKASMESWRSGRKPLLKPSALKEKR